MKEIVRSFLLQTFIPLSNIFPLFIACALVSFIGCSSVTSIHINSQQPVYFGSPSKTILDSAQTHFIGTFTATTSHTAENEKTTTAKNLEITTGGTETTENNIEHQIAKTCEGDSDKFISDVFIQAKVEAYIPWYTTISDLAASMITGESSTSTGLGETSSEAMTMKGKVYRQERKKQ
jgi:hypothetical protein